MRGYIIAISLGIYALAMGPAMARNEVYYFPIGPVLDSADFSKRIGGGMHYFFGDASAPDFEPIAGGQDSIGNGAVHFHDRTEQEACNDAFLDALAELKEHAEDLRGTVIVNITSYFRRKIYSSPEQYECHVGLTGSKVTLRGVVSRLKS